MQESPTPTDILAAAGSGIWDSAHQQQPKASRIPYPQLYPAILPVLASRAIGMHFDAEADLPRVDYRQFAAQLLTACLGRQPQALRAQ